MDDGDGYTEVQPKNKSFKVIILKKNKQLL